MTEEKSLFEKLNAEIETRILPKTNYPYIPAREIRTRLNKTFDCFWDTEIFSEKIINEETVLLKLRLTAKVGEKSICKEAFGSSTIQKFSGGINKGKPVNLGDAYNNAVMDAIKSCSKQLGIGNRQMDVVKDPKTGKYVEVSENISEDISESTKPSIKKQEELKTDNKQSAVEKTNKTVELKKRLEALKNKTNTSVEPIIAEKKEEQVKEEPVIPQKPENNSVVDHGFNYDELNGTTDSPKNTQKLVILNLAKMKGVTIEDYIKQIIGKQKSIDDLTASEAGLIVRSGLTSTTFKE